MSSGKQAFYITTTLPYVNAEAHLGHAMEFIRADIIARYKKSLGYEVFLNTGTDEHGQKLFLTAQKAGKDVKAYVDEYAEKFKTLLPTLGISEDIHFIRTTDVHHEKAAQEFWRRVAQNGYIYKKNYKTKYCVGCEAEKTESELIEGRCSIHTNTELELIEEENYFFKFSVFGEKLLAFYDRIEKEEKRSFVIPEFRLNEMREFIKNGLEDFSISRLRSKMSWGVPVPDDADHVMYVWFDALVNYISTLGWPENTAVFEKFWTNGTPTQYCGKDNTRFQAVMWQAMLMAASLPNSHTIVVNGFITAEGGMKMSKSLGNVISPLDLVNEYSTDALRYFVAREISLFEDSPVTIERFKASYNAGLANGIGNLTSRILKMYSSYFDRPYPYKEEYKHIVENSDLTKNIHMHLEQFDVASAMNVIWNEIGALDAHIQNTKPFSVFKTDPDKARELVAGKSTGLMYKLLGISVALEPFMPETARKIQKAVEDNKLESPLFLRKE